MLKKLLHLFILKSRLEAWLVIYAIAAGAVARGTEYMQIFPGYAGVTMFFGSTAVVFLAGGALLDYVTAKRAAKSLEL